MRRLMAPACICLLAVLSGSCTKTEQNTSAGSGVAQPVLSSVSNRDEEMDKATMTARAMVGNFLAALKSPKPDQSDFSVKKVFRDGSSSDEIWLTNVSFDGKLLHGIVSDTSVTVRNVRRGSRGAVRPDEIADWMYVENGVLKGGYTVRVFYKRQPLEKKKSFFDETGLVFEEDSGPSPTLGIARTPAQ